jgi:hypothetical protein
MNHVGVAPKGTDVGAPENYLGYQPTDPLPAEMVMVYDEELGELKPTLWAALLDEAGTVRDLLPLQSAEVSVSKTDMSGSVSYLTSSLTAGSGAYTVTMDYMKYRVEDVHDDETNAFIGNARVGVGLRIKAVVQTTETGLNLGSLIAIGAEAKRGTLREGIAVDVIGIDSPDVTNLIPLTSEIDQTSIQSALQALASIKTKISDDDTRLTPHVVALKQARPGTKEKIKQETSIARERGVARGITNIERKQVILARVAPGGNLDRSTWDRLVDASMLDEATKTELKELNDFAGLDDRLDTDAGMRGEVISALYAKLKQL